MEAEMKGDKKIYGGRGNVVVELEKELSLSCRRWQLVALRLVPPSVRRHRSTAFW